MLAVVGNDNYIFRLCKQLPQNDALSNYVDGVYPRLTPFPALIPRHATLDRRVGVRLPAETRQFSLIHSVHTAGTLSMWVKGPQREATTSI
jgi:hypothetical protein